jgi:hypothetical protein
VGIDWQRDVTADEAARRAGGRRRYNAERRLRAFLRLRKVADVLFATQEWRPRGFIRQAALARQLGVSRSTVCRDVHKLIDRRPGAWLPDPGEEDPSPGKRRRAGRRGRGQRGRPAGPAQQAQGDGEPRAVSPCPSRFLAVCAPPPPGASTAADPTGQRVTSGGRRARGGTGGATTDVRTGEHWAVNAGRLTRAAEIG